MSIKNCLIVSNTTKAASAELVKEMGAFLREQGIVPEEYLFSGGEGTGHPFTARDFVITLGGDGTVLFAARGCAPLGIPIFPVNLGKFGFITTIPREAWRENLTRFLAGDFPLEAHTMVEVSVAGMHNQSSNALNDVVITATKNVKKIIALDVVCGGISLGRFAADGLIVSSATGSTAYSAAAGGPIIDPRLDVLVLTAVCPFSLSSRPLVLPPDSVLELSPVLDSSAAPLQVLVDGQFLCDAGPEEKIIVQKSRYPCRIAGSGASHFYRTLRSKMNWAGGPYA
ncbi:MAG: NAD(+)/NADH kinase [Spirochaetaceae bacterium]|nr:NAD(+)/NADH kinase [Spirochaetaceae bacterium]